MQARGERRCVNRPWLNGLCVAARVCLLYMLFDPDMISWRERGPGWASLRTLGGPAPSFSLPLAPWPSCPLPQPAALGSLLPDRTCQKGTLLGSEEGSGSRGRGHIPPECVSQDMKWEPPAHNVPLARADGVQVGPGSHPVSLNSSPSSRSEGLPLPRARSQQRLAEGLSTVWQQSEASAFSVQLNIARLPWPHQEESGWEHRPHGPARPCPSLSFP